MPVHVAQAERLFSVMKRINNFQDRLNGLATLNNNYQIERILDNSEIISEFANINGRKASAR